MFFKDRSLRFLKKCSRKYSHLFTLQFQEGTAVDDDDDQLLLLSDGEYSEEELASLSVNLGSLGRDQRGLVGSDTEADFLDKDVQGKLLAARRLAAANSGLNCDEEAGKKNKNKKNKKQQQLSLEEEEEEEEDEEMLALGEIEKDAHNNMADDEHSLCGSDVVGPRRRQQQHGQQLASRARASKVGEFFFIS